MGWYIDLNHFDSSTTPSCGTGGGGSEMGGIGHQRGRVRIRMESTSPSVGRLEELQNMGGVGHQWGGAR